MFSIFLKYMFMGKFVVADLEDTIQKISILFKDFLYMHIH